MDARTEPAVKVTVKVKATAKVKVRASARAMRRKMAIAPWLFLAPPLAMYCVWVIYPTLATFVISLTSWDGLSKPRFVGLGNYVSLFGNWAFRTSLLNNVRWLAVFLAVPAALGLTLAVVLNRSVRFDRVFKASIYSPMVLSPVVIGLIWCWIYLPRDGLLNLTLKAVGLPSFARGWLDEPGLVLYSIIAAASWRHTGYAMILFLAGLKTVDPYCIEAARVDGASPWQVFRHVTFPLLLPATTVVMVVTIIDSLRAFDLVNVMTDGGPFNSSNVLANLMYKETFHNYRMGYGAAIAVVLFGIMFSFIVTYLRQVARQEVEY